jgi:hypothetical protein
MTPHWRRLYRKAVAARSSSPPSGTGTKDKCVEGLEEVKPMEATFCANYSASILFPIMEMEDEVGNPWYKRLRPVVPTYWGACRSGSVTVFR